MGCRGGSCGSLWLRRHALHTELAEILEREEPLQQLGGVFGVAVLAAVFARGGSYASPEAFTEGMVPAVLIGAAFVAVGAAAAFVIPRARRAEDVALVAEPGPAFLGVIIVRIVSAAVTVVGGLAFSPFLVPVGGNAGAAESLIRARICPGGNLRRIDRPCIAAAWPVACV